MALPGTKLLRVSDASSPLTIMQQQQDTFTRLVCPLLDLPLPLARQMVGFWYPPL